MRRGVRKPRRGLARPASGLWRRLAAAAAALAAALASPAPATAETAAPQDRLGGLYRGLDAAEGRTLRLTPTEIGFDGVLRSNGRETTFVAVGDATGALADSVQDAGGEVALSIAPRPFGLMLVRIPKDAAGALRPDAAEAQIYARADFALPDLPDALAPPPIEPTASFDAIAFLESYEFWAPREVGFAYVSLTDRARTLIRLYAHVHTDILWKLCAGPPETLGRVEALEGQAITCPGVIAAIADQQRRGVFGRYKADLAVAKNHALEAMRCATGGLTPAICAQVAQRTSAAAVSLETAKGVLARY